MRDPLDGVAVVATCPVLSARSPLRLLPQQQSFGAMRMPFIHPHCFGENRISVVPGEAEA